jgi:hypothetical protein
MPEHPRPARLGADNPQWVNPNTGKPMTDWTVERKQADMPR